MSGTGPTHEVPEMSARARELLTDATVCDLTLPWGPGYANQETVLERYTAAGVDFVSLTVGVDRMGLAETVRHVATERARISRTWGDRCLFVECVADIERARIERRLAVGFHFQGSNPLDGDPNMVELYYRSGIRHMLFAYNQKNLAADGCHERTDEGLSRYGRTLVAEMNRVGMIVDATHCGYRTSLEVMEASSAPAIFSHSNAWAVHPHARNLRDEQIRACAATGGFVGINGVGHFLSPDMVASAEAVARHVDHVVGLVGPRHVALGLDHVYYLEQQHARRRAMPDAYPEGYPPPNFSGSYLGPEDLPAIIGVLIGLGYSDDDIRAILGGNFLRVARGVWQ